MEKKQARKCGNCGGKVYLVVKTDTIEHPARDNRGREIFEMKQDKVTGQWFEKQVMVSWPIRGLGTWHCTNGCKDALTNHPKVVSGLAKQAAA